MQDQGSLKDMFLRKPDAFLQIFSEKTIANRWLGGFNCHVPNGRWLSKASARSLASLAPALWLTALCPGTSPRGLGRLQPFGTAKQGK